LGQVETVVRKDLEALVRKGWVAEERTYVELEAHNLVEWVGHTPVESMMVVLVVVDMVLEELVQV